MSSADARSVQVTVRGWLYVLNWGLQHAGGVNEVVRNLFDLTETSLGSRPLLLIKEWSRRSPALDIENGRLTAHASWPTPWSRTRGFRHLLSFLMRLPQAVLQLRRLLVTQNVATVHLHFPGVDLLIWRFVQLAVPQRLRIIVSFHGLDLKQATSARGIERLVWTIALRRADHITVCADAMRSALAERFPGLASRVSVIANGVSSARIREVSAGVPRSRLPDRYAFAASTYEHKKGLDVLLSAFERIAERHPNLELVVTGRSNGPCYGSLDRLRTSLRAADRIQLLRDLPHDETMRCLGRAQCFVLPSREEPFGIVLLEAASLAIPSVATTSCGALEYFDSSSDLRVVAPDDVAALANAIDALLVDPADATRRAMHMRSTVENRLEWTQVIQAYSRLG